MKKALLAAVLCAFATTAAFAQSFYPSCYIYHPDITTGIITDVSNLATRVAAPPLINGNNMNLFANMGVPFPTVASGEVLSIIGQVLVPNGAPNVYDATWPTTLNGTQVLVNGKPAPIYYAGWRRDGVPYAIANAEIIVQLPYGLTGPTVSVQVKTIPDAACQGLPQTLQLTPTNTGLVRNQDGTVAVQTTTGTFLTAKSTVRAGDELVVYFFGGGDVVDKSVQAGKLATHAVTVLNPGTVMFEGIQAQVDYIGLTPGTAGVYQANFKVPAVGAGPHVVKFGTETFSVTVTQ